MRMKCLRDLWINGPRKRHYHIFHVFFNFIFVWQSTNPIYFNNNNNFQQLSGQIFYKVEGMFTNISSKIELIRISNYVGNEKILFEKFRLLIRKLILSKERDINNFLQCRQCVCFNIHIVHIPESQWGKKRKETFF